MVTSSVAQRRRLPTSELARLRLRRGAWRTLASPLKGGVTLPTPTEPAPPAAITRAAFRSAWIVYPQAWQRKTACLGPFPRSQWPQHEHVCEVSRGSISMTSTPASRAVYLMNSRRWANGQECSILALSRC
jgi:hypothetical protein